MEALLLSQPLAGVAAPFFPHRRRPSAHPTFPATPKPKVINVRASCANGSNDHPWNEREHEDRSEGKPPPFSEVEVSFRVDAEVVDRVARRAGWAVCAPLALWAARWWLRWDRPPLWLTLAAVAAGITYTALSASWDPPREGSLLGLGEVRRNCAALAAAAARVAETVDGMEEDSELQLTFRARFPEQ